jgi:hypothetical protein
MPIIESKEAASYTDNGSPAEHCAICEHYRSAAAGESGLCRIVSGTVLSGGWCRHFTPVHEAAD